MIDIRTLVMLALFSSLLLASAVMFFNLNSRGDPAVRAWAWGAGLGAVAFVLFALRGTVPDWISVVLASSVGVAGRVWIYFGHRLYLGLEPGRRWDIPASLLTAAVLSACSEFMPDPFVCQVLGWSALCALHFLSATLLLSPTVRKRGPDRGMLTMIGLAHLLTGLVLGLRVALASLAPRGAGLHQAAGLMDVVIIGSIAAFNIALTVGLCSLVVSRGQRRLQANEERYRSLVEQAADGILVTDMAGTLIDINDAGAQMLGHSPQEMIGMNVSDLVAEEERPGLAEGRAKFATGEVKAASIQRRFRRKDGSHFNGEVMVKRLSDGRVLGLLRDITQHKQIEAVLLQAKLSAEAASRSKSDFVANMSHEIRTPLNAIMGMTYLMRRDSVDAKQTERLDQIDIASSHLLSIVNDVLDIAKTESGKLVLERAAFTLSDLQYGVNSLMAERVRVKGLDLHVDLSALPAALMGDRTRLTQALVNYLSNAVKFTERGSISLNARVLERKDSQVLVRFEVADTGIGIAPESLVRLFSAFEQADGSTTRRYGGSGLGLAITGRLAKLMGGETGAQSVPGQGSTFWFTAWLESTDAEPAAASRPAEPPALRGSLLLHACRNRKVLLVEDDPVNQVVAQELLGGAGLQFELAETGTQAVQMAAHTAYDLILMDMFMPEMDGLEATRRIRALPDRVHVPIVAMTANAFSEDRQSCLAAGMNDFIEKPVNPNKLFAIVQHWLTQADRA